MIKFLTDIIHLCYIFDKQQYDFTKNNDMFNIGSNNVDLINSLELLLKLIGVIYTLVIFTVGLIRYSRDQKWKRNEFVAEQAKIFYTDKMVCNTMYMLDYTTRDITRTIELFPEYPNRDDRYIEVNIEMLKSALQLHNLKSKPQYTQVEVAIRDNFDRFFNYFEIFEQYIDAGLITHKELEPYLNYWIQTISKRYLPEDTKNIIHAYIDSYNFKGTQNLINRYENPVTTIYQRMIKIINKPLHSLKKTKSHSNN